MAISDKGGNHVPPGSRHAAPDGADKITNPLFAWAVRTDFRYLGGPPSWIPLLVHAPKHTALEIAAAFPEGFVGDDPPLFIPALFLTPPPGLEKLRFFCLSLNWGVEQRVSAIELLAHLERQYDATYDFGLPVGPGTVVPPPVPSLINSSGLGPPPPFGIGGPPLTGPTPGFAASQAVVVTGVIDDAFAVANDRFRSTGGSTRISSVWVQELGQGGTEITDTLIDATVYACTHCGLVDESQVYKVLGLENYGNPEHKAVARKLAHGTHVMDIAAGYDAGTGPSERPIIGVQLPESVVRDTSGATLAPWAYWAMVYILARSLAFGNKPGDVPVVVNLSYGLFHGPHDGTSPFELAVDELIRTWSLQFPKGKLCVVLPAGNNYLWRSHAHFDLPSGQIKPLEWRLVPDDRTISSMEIRLPHPANSGQTSTASVQVTAPDGTSSGWMTVGDPPFIVPGPVLGSTPLWQVTSEATSIKSSRPNITIIVAPTAVYDPHAPNEPTAPSGVWRVDVKNDGPHTTIDAWILRDDTPLGWPVLGRQSYFDDPSYARFDGAGRWIEIDNSSYAQRQGTINGLATGARTVVVGGCRASDLAVARYSAAGPIVSRPAGYPSPRVGPDPDAAAISEDSPARHGILAAGTRSNTVVAMGGTSVAAPQLTRWIAGQMAMGNSSCRPAVDALADGEENQRQPPHPPSYRIGDGRINDLEPQLPPPREQR